MAYNSSSDNFGKIVNQGIFTLLNTEFPRENIVYQPEFRMQDLGTRGQYFRIYSTGSDPLETGTRWDTRSYNYQVSYYYKYSGDNYKQEYDNIITDKWDHFYYYLMGYRSYEPSSGYTWHNVVFEDVPGVVWGFDDEHKTVGHIDAEVSFWRTNDLELTDIAAIQGISI